MTREPAVAVEPVTDLGVGHRERPYGPHHRAHPTREAILALRTRDPDANAAEIGRSLGVSRERVRQLLRAMGLPRGRRSRPPAAARVVTGGIVAPVSTTIAGTISELLVAADLLARGYQVFAPVARRGRCDLISLDPATGLTERLEVRCGIRTQTGSVTYRRHDPVNADRAAIVLTGEAVVYDPPLPAAHVQGLPRRSLG